MNDRTHLVEAVKAHALRKYGKGGWDYVVECWDDSKILEAIGHATTEKGAIQKVKAWADLLGDVRAEVQAAAFVMAGIVVGYVQAGRRRRETDGLV